MFVCLCVCLWRQASCGQSGLLASEKRRNTTPGFEVGGSEFTIEAWGLYRALLSITCTSSKWLCGAQAKVGGESSTLLISEKQCGVNTSTVVSHCGRRGPKVCPESTSTRIQLGFFSTTPKSNLSLLRTTRSHRKKPNVCLLSPIFTSNLPPFCPSATLVLAVPPVPVAEPPRTTLHAAVQRQSQRPQLHQLPQLFPWGVLPAADWTDQRDSEPGSQRPVTVCCQGPGVLHSGPEGKTVILFQQNIRCHLVFL